jgi:hypothetical protein
MDRIPNPVTYKYKKLLIALSSILACVGIPGESGNSFPILKPTTPQVLNIDVDNFYRSLGGIDVGFTDPHWYELLHGIDVDKIWEFIDSEFACSGSKPRLILYDNLTQRNIHFFFHGALFEYSDIVENDSGLTIELYEQSNPENPSGIIIINMANVVPFPKLEKRPRHLFYTTILALLYHETLHACQLDMESLNDDLDRQASEEYAYGLTHAIEQLMQDVDITERIKETRSFEDKHIKKDTKDERKAVVTPKDLSNIRKSFNAASLTQHYGFNIEIQVPSKSRYQNLSESLEEVTKHLES